MNLREITPMILTFNEEANLARCLQGLQWAEEILVIDSGSTDQTLAILAADPRVRLIHRPFDDFASQCNYGLGLVRTPWVLSLDADYRVGADWLCEVEGLQIPPALHGLACGFDYWVLGGALRRSLYPPRTVLYRRDHANYRQDGHAHRVMIDGEVSHLRSRLVHDDRKDMQRWLLSQQRYAQQEAEKLLQHEGAGLALQDRLRRTGWAAIPAVVLYTLFWRGLIWQGRRGLYYTWQRLIAECLLGLAILEKNAGKKLW